MVNREKLYLTNDEGCSESASIDGSQDVIAELFRICDFLSSEGWTEQEQLRFIWNFGRRREEYGDNEAVIMALQDGISETMTIVLDREGLQ